MTANGISRWNPYGWPKNHPWTACAAFLPKPLRAAVQGRALLLWDQERNPAVDALNPGGQADNRMISALLRDLLDGAA